MWAITSSALFGLFTVAISRTVGWLTDNYIVPIVQGEKSATHIWIGASVLLLVITGLAVSVVYRRIYAAHAVYGLQAQHREGLSAQFVSLPPRWHKRRSTGDLLSHVSSDAEAATSVFNPFPYMLGSTVMFIVSAVMLILVDWWLALAAFLILPLMIIANLVFQKKMTPAVTLAQQLRAEVSQAAHESFEGASLVKALGARDEELRKFSRSTTGLRNANARVGVVRALFDPIIDALPNIGTLLVIAVGIVRLQQGAVIPGDVVSAAYLLTLLSVPARSFGWVLAEIPRSVVGFERVGAVIAVPREVFAPIAPAQAGPAASRTGLGAAGTAVHFESVGYIAENDDEKSAIVSNASFTAEHGATTVLMGRTGAGKTTLVSMIPRLWAPSSGSVRIGERDVTAVSRAELSHTVAFVSQGSFVFEDSVRANVTLDDREGSAFTDEQVWEALEVAQLADFVRAAPAGLDAHLGEMGSNLSGGQRQRLAIARAVVRAPRVLVLDDATSALDPEIEQAILRKISQGSDTTIIMVAYRAATAALADKVVFLDNGEITGEGTHSQLLGTHAGYRELVNAYDKMGTSDD